MSLCVYCGEYIIHPKIRTSLTPIYTVQCRLSELLSERKESVKFLDACGNTRAMICETVKGRNKRYHVKIFTLSTCGWCKKTKELLKSLDVEYEYVDVDKLSGNDLAEAMEEVGKYNPYRTYPTIIIDKGKHVILGYKDDEIKEKLG